MRWRQLRGYKRRKRPGPVTSPLPGQMEGKTQTGVGEEPSVPPQCCPLPARAPPRRRVPTSLLVQGGEADLDTLPIVREGWEEEEGRGEGVGQFFENPLFRGFQNYFQTSKAKATLSP